MNRKIEEFASELWRGDPRNGINQGMTIRDWFAGQAVSGIIAQSNLEGWEPAITAKWAYEIADSMLEARK